MSPAPAAAAVPHTGAPDAVLYPLGWIDPATPQKTNDRNGYLHDLIEPILGGGPGKRVLMKPLIGHGTVLATLESDPQGTFYFHTGHVYEGQPRYDWVPQENGLSYGYFRPDPARV